MAIETVTIKDADGNDIDIAVDTVAGVSTQLFKLGFSADGGVPTQVSANDPLPVSLGSSSNNIGSVYVVSVVSGTGPTNLSKAHNGGYATGDANVGAMAVRQDSDGTLVSGTGRYSLMQLDANGFLKVNVKAGSLAGPSVNDNAAFTVGTTPVSPSGGVYQASIASLTSGNSAAGALTIKRSRHTTMYTPLGDSMTDDTLDALNVKVVGGSIAGIVDDSVVTIGTTEVLMGGYMADDTATDSVNEGDGGMARMTLNRKQISQPYESEPNHWQYAAPAAGLVNTTGVTAKASAGAGLRNYITAIQVMNSHQTIGTEVEIRDGASGTVIHRGWAAPNSGYTNTFVTPLKGTAATLIQIAEVTATASAGVLVNLQGYIGA